MSYCVGAGPVSNTASNTLLDVSEDPSMVTTLGEEIFHILLFIIIMCLESFQADFASKIFC